jgi:hypothetical protein
MVFVEQLTRLVLMMMVFFHGRSFSKNVQRLLVSPLKTLRKMHKYSLGNF